VTTAPGVWLDEMRSPKMDVSRKASRDFREAQGSTA